MVLLVAKRNAGMGVEFRAGVGGVTVAGRLGEV